MPTTSEVIIKVSADITEATAAFEKLAESAKKAADEVARLRQMMPWYTRAHSWVIGAARSAWAWHKATKLSYPAWAANQFAVGGVVPNPGTPDKVESFYRPTIRFSPGVSAEQAKKSLDAMRDLYPSLRRALERDPIITNEPTYCNRCNIRLTKGANGVWVSDTSYGPKSVCHPQFGDYLHTVNETNETRPDKLADIESAAKKYIESRPNGGSNFRSFSYIMNVYRFVVRQNRAWLDMTTLRAYYRLLNFLETELRVLYPGCPVMKRPRPKSILAPKGRQ